MLTEIRSDKFRTKYIEFHEGLNVILGDENATNSIGKSTLLMVVDFAFGGDTLLEHNTDLIEELGHHDYFITFKFGGEQVRFQRNTETPRIIHKCDENFEQLSSITIEEYTNFLKAAYNINIEEISFRTLVGLFLRVWGKDNLSVDKPLHIVQVQPGKDCVDNLIKTFNKYSPIRDLDEQLRSKDKERKALSSALTNKIIHKIGKRDYKNNQQKIQEITKEVGDIKDHLAQYATNLSAIVNKEVLELKVQKDNLLATKLILESKLARLRMNLSNSRSIKSHYFNRVTKFFPNADTARLADVEEFHDRVAKLLGSEIKKSEKEITEQISLVDSEISGINFKMSATLASVDQPSQIIDRVFELSGSLVKAKHENQYYDDEHTLKESVSSLKESLSTKKSQVITVIQGLINQTLRKIVSSVFGAERKSPILSLTENNYSYQVFEDTGTGTAYAGMIVLDLAIFKETILPVIAHDSVLFKNIENNSVAKLFKTYIAVKKQSFVAIDEISKYGTETATLLMNNKVIQLDNDNVLYVKDWRNKKGATST